MKVFNRRRHRAEQEESPSLPPGQVEGGFPTLGLSLRQPIERFYGHESIAIQRVRAPLPNEQRQLHPQRFLRGILARGCSSSQTAEVPRPEIRNRSFPDQRRPPVDFSVRRQCRDLLPRFVDGAEDGRFEFHLEIRSGDRGRSESAAIRHEGIDGLVVQQFVHPQFQQQQVVLFVVVLFILNSGITFHWEAFIVVIGVVQSGDILVAFGRSEEF